jgi:hypothetical protein
MAYKYLGTGGFYQYIIGGTTSTETYSGTPFVILSPSQISETNLESIAEILCGGTPPTGWFIQKDEPPVTTKTY